jgi:hypothetical protein
VGAAAGDLGGRLPVHAAAHEEHVGALVLLNIMLLNIMLLNIIHLNYSN